MEATVQIQAEKIENRLIKKFNDPFYQLQEVTKEMIIFNYSNFWDSRTEYSEDIREEENFLISESNKLQNKNLNIFFFIGDIAIKIN